MQQKENMQQQFKNKQYLFTILKHLCSTSMPTPPDACEHHNNKYQNMVLVLNKYCTIADALRAAQLYDILAQRFTARKSESFCIR